MKFTPPPFIFHFWLPKHPWHFEAKTEFLLWVSGAKRLTAHCWSPTQRERAAGFKSWPGQPPKAYAAWNPYWHGHEECIIFLSGVIFLRLIGRTQDTPDLQIEALGKHCMKAVLFRRSRNPEKTWRSKKETVACPVWRRVNTITCLRCHMISSFFFVKIRQTS